MSGTHEWKRRGAGVGKWQILVREVGTTDWSVIPGLVLGGQGHWVVQRHGHQWGETYRSIKAAAMDMIAVQFREEVTV